MASRGATGRAEITQQAPGKMHFGGEPKPGPTKRKLHSKSIDYRLLGAGTLRIV